MENSKQTIRWVLRAQAGDREAFDELLRRIQSPLFRYILSLVGARAPAEDILQDVFIILYRKLTWLRDPELFRPWAYRIATREAFRHLRRERRWSDPPDDAAAPEQAFDAALLASLPQLVGQVPPASRAVIVLHYLDEMPLADVAGVLGISIGTVKSRLAYGLASLRKQLSLGERSSP
jgi:RNA polymerase sigma-70 factor (ECF subfamily)